MKAQKDQWDEIRCYFPSYFATFTVVMLLSLTTVLSIPSSLKIFLTALVLAIGGASMYIEPLKSIYYLSEMINFTNGQE